MVSCTNPLWSGVYYLGGFVPSRKLPLALCVAQTAATAILTFWADRMEWMRGDSNRIIPRSARLNYVILDLRNTWRSINAPTFPLNYAGLKSFHVLGLSAMEILYLIAVAVLWYLVGYFREQEGMQKRRAVAIAILLWGVILLFISIAMMPAIFKAGFLIPLGLLNASLYAVWALLLIRFGVKNLRALSQAQGNGRS